MTETQALQLFKCLGDKSRLQILKSLAKEDMYVELLAQRMGLSAATVSFHLKKLTEAGAVRMYKTQYYAMYALEREVFQARIIDVIGEESSQAQLQTEREEAYRQRVLDTFFEYGVLKSIPVQRKKKRIVLEKIVQSFETQRVYAESEVNEILLNFHEDFCTLRRDLISEGLMTREKNEYRKADS